MGGRKYPQPHNIEKQLEESIDPAHMSRVPIDKIHNGIKKNGYFDMSRYYLFFRRTFLRRMGKKSNGHKTRPYKTG